MIQTTQEDKRITIENSAERYTFEIPKEFENLTPNQFWLLQHQITSFWHSFGFSSGSGLIIPKEKLKEFKFPNERTYKYFVLDKDFLSEKLGECLINLVRYKQSWNEDFDHECYPHNLDKFLADEKETSSRNDILLFFILLQNFVNIKVRHEEIKIPKELRGY